MSKTSPNCRNVLDEACSGINRRLLPVTKWNEYHAWPPIGGLRYLIFHEKENGFHAVVKRIGRKVLIDEAEFFNWVDAQSEEKQK